MKIKRIFAGMAASAIAMSAFAMTSTVSASAEAATYTAGICFQTNETWNYRDLPGTDGSRAIFPAAEVGVQGGAYGISTDVAVSDTTIQYDGTYTVSIATSGTLSEANPDKAGTKDDLFLLNPDEPEGNTRSGSTWSMLKNTEPKASEDSTASVAQEAIEWVDGKITDKFNMLSIATNIPCEYNDEDKPVVNDKVIEFSDVKVSMPGGEYTPVEGVYYKSDIDTVACCLINSYGDSTIDPAAMPTEDGTITVTFTIKGLGEAPAESTAESSSAANSTGSNGGSSNSKSGGSNAGTDSNKSSSSKAAGGTSASAASDATASADTGATAGIALALAAVAGAAIVVSRKK